MATLVERILIGSWCESVAAFASGKTVQRDGILVAMTGLPTPANNPGLVVSEPSDAVGALRWGIKERGLLGTGYDIPLGRYPSVERALMEIGHVQLLQRPAMIVPIDDLRQRRAPADLQIERVSSQVGVNTVAAIQAVGFKADPDGEAAALPLSLVTAPTTFLALGQVDGVPVACALVVRSPEGVAVFGVATDPSAQGNGYASAVTAAAIRAVAQPGDHAALQSSDVGYRVYAAMGFVDAGPWAVWVAPNELPPQ